MATKEKQLSFEQAIQKLEEAAEKLKSDSVSLEDSMKLYDESQKYYEICKDILDNAKQRIQIIKPETGETEAFEEL